MAVNVKIKLFCWIEAKPSFYYTFFLFLIPFLFSSRFHFIEFEHTHMAWAWLLVGSFSWSELHVKWEIFIYSATPNEWTRKKKIVSKLNIGSRKKFIVWMAIVFCSLYISFFFFHRPFACLLNSKLLSHLLFTL